MKNYKWKNNGKHRKSNKHICGNTAAVMTNALLELLWTTTFQLSHTVTRLSRLTLVWRMWTVGLSRPVSVQDAKHFACLRPAKSCKVDMIHTTLHQVTIDCSYTCQPYSKINYMEQKRPLLRGASSWLYWCMCPPKKRKEKHVQ